jgi:hypothetical protein
MHLSQMTKTSSKIFMKLAVKAMKKKHNVPVNNRLTLIHGKQLARMLSIRAARNKALNMNNHFRIYNYKNNNKTLDKLINKIASSGNPNKVRKFILAAKR